ncbi:MAG: GNAT family N-acetyltransferase [Marinilabiliaceae bacterium]
MPAPASSIPKFEEGGPLEPAHLPRSAINTEKWDACVRNSLNETPLAYSWVLDHLNPGWEAIVFGDYEGVMPLPVSYRLGIKMIQMPPEVLTLGIFSNNEKIIHQFPGIFNHPIFSKFRFIGYNGSPAQKDFSGAQDTIIKQTQELKLNKSYDKLHQKFSRSHRRSIRAFYDAGGKISEDSDPGLFTDLLAKKGANRAEIFIPLRYRQNFNMMAKTATSRKKGTTYSVWKDGKPVAASFFLIGNSRVVPYHLANEEGQHLKASFALIDHFIRKYAESNLTLDFAGSVIPNVAEFNRRFGAVSVPYPSVRINRLPWLMRAAKDTKLLFRIKHLWGNKIQAK